MARRQRREDRSPSGERGGVGVVGWGHLSLLLSWFLAPSFCSALWGISTQGHL